MKRTETTHIIIHTAAWPGDPSAKLIRRVHVQENGWDDIGYHFVIRKDGTIESGRPVYKVGAHCKDQGMNHKSIGICLSGHHDHEFLEGNQKAALFSLLNDLVAQYEIPIPNILGHRETGANKTCPGTHVDMLAIRKEMAFGGSLTKAKVPDDLRLSDLNIEPLDLSDKKVTIPDPVDPNEFKIPLHNKVSRFFRNTKAGKVITTGAVTGVALLTGVNLNDLIPQNNMEILEAIPLDIIVEYGLYLVLFLIGLFIKKPGWKKFIQSKIEAAAPVIVASVDEKSEGGQRMTPGEVKSILSAIFKKNDN
ncbi:MAG: N-acetylmuramoyl-L-alanine amidase [Balneola sp.]